MPYDIRTIGERLARKLRAGKASKQRGEQMPRYSTGQGGSDPRWITARTDGKRCSRCTKKISKGQRVFYYPNTQTMLCWGDDCGVQAQRDLDAALHDEAFMASQFGGW